MFEWWDCVVRSHYLSALALADSDSRTVIFHEEVNKLGNQVLLHHVEQLRSSTLGQGAQELKIAFSQLVILTQRN